MSFIPIPELIKRTEKLLMMTKDPEAIETAKELIRVLDAIEADK